MSIQFVQQTGLLENTVDFITELSAHIPAVLTSQMMMAEIAVKTTNDYITDIFCKELNEVKQCKLVVFIFFIIAAEYVVMNSWNGNAVCIITIERRNLIPQIQTELLMVDATASHPVRAMCRILPCEVIVVFLATLEQLYVYLFIVGFSHRSSNTVTLGVICHMPSFQADASSMEPLIRIGHKSLI